MTLFRRWVLMSLILGIVGCQKAEERVVTYSVKGQLLEGNKPLAHATVVFHPVGTAAVAFPRPRGKTDDSGTFVLTTFDSNDGAPAGAYQVTVELWQTPNPNQGPVNRIAPRYAKPGTSGFRADVTTGTNELAPIVLKK